MAAGNSPSMIDKNIGKVRNTFGPIGMRTELPRRWKELQTSHPANIPANNFWSVVVYDALSRSELQTGQPFPSVSVYTKPIVNADGSIDIIFGPDEPNQKSNWIKTVPGNDVRRPAGKSLLPHVGRRALGIRDQRTRRRPPPGQGCS